MTPSTDRYKGTTQEGQHIEGWMCQCGHRSGYHRIFHPRFGHCEKCECEQGVWTDLPPIDPHRNCKGVGLSTLLVKCRTCADRKMKAMHRGQEVQRMQLARIISIHNRNYPEARVTGYSKLLQQYGFED